MRFSNVLAASKALGLAFALAALFANTAAADHWPYTIPREAAAINVYTGEPIMAPPIPYGHYAKSTSDYFGVVGKHLGCLKCAFGGINGLGQKLCGHCGGKGCGACEGTGLFHGKGHHGHQGACGPNCGGGGGGGDGGGGGLFHHGSGSSECGMCGGAGCGLCSRSGGGLFHHSGGAGHSIASPQTYVVAPGRVHQKHAIHAAHAPGKAVTYTVASPQGATGSPQNGGGICGDCGGRGCGRCGKGLGLGHGGRGLGHGGGGLGHGGMGHGDGGFAHGGMGHGGGGFGHGGQLCDSCGGKGCGKCGGSGLLGKLCKFCGGKGCRFCGGAKSLLNHILHPHANKVQYFVGAGGPVPITPGYVPYVVTTRSPRDYFAFPPFSDIDP